MFLQYSVPGAYIPLFSLRLQELGFTPLQIGWTCATQALASLIAPLVAGQVADRWVPAQRCLTVCAFLSGLLLWHLAGLSEPGAVFAASFAVWLLMGPAMMLGVALSFTHLADPQREFGRVRMWGTVGWVVPGLALGYWFSDPAWLAGLHPGASGSELADAIRLAGLLAFTLAAYSVTLPHTPPQRRTGHWLAPLAAVRLLSGRNFAVFTAGAFGVCATLPFTAQVTPLLLAHLGFARAWLSPILTVAQSMEIVSLGMLPLLLSRLGTRGTMLLGLGAWATALLMLTIGWPPGLVVGSLALNGLCISCYIVAGQVFVNSRARGDIRASAQALLTVLNGIGMLMGNLLVGWVRRQTEGQFATTFAVGAAIALLLAIGFCAGFREEEAAPD